MAMDSSVVIDVTCVALGQVVLRPTTPLRLLIQHAPDAPALLVVEAPAIGLHAFAFTRAELLAEVEEQIRFLWQNYAQAPRAGLAPDAVRLADALQRAFIQQPA